MNKTTGSVSAASPTFLFSCFPIAARIEAAMKGEITNQKSIFYPEWYEGL
jgi:hypothetical protein